MKIALLGPSFFGYVSAIEDVIKAKGYFAEYFDERRSNSILSKILCRLTFIIGSTKSQKDHVQGIVSHIIANDFTHVVIISCETLSLNDVVKIRSAGIVVYCYMWDAIKNKRSVLKYIKVLNGVASFDRFDCKNNSRVFLM